MAGQNIAVFGIYRDREGVERAVDVLRGADGRRRPAIGVALDAFDIGDVARRQERPQDATLEHHQGTL